MKYPDYMLQCVRLVGYLGSVELMYLSQNIQRWIVWHHSTVEKSAAWFKVGRGTASSPSYFPYILICYHTHARTHAHMHAYTHAMANLSWLQSRNPNKCLTYIFTHAKYAVRIQPLPLSRNVCGGEWVNRCECVGVYVSAIKRKHLIGMTWNLT